MDKGTITWFAVHDTLPPPDPTEPDGTWSIQVLLYDKEGFLSFGKYYPSLDKFRHNSGNWQPTHWAFINLPS